MAAPVKISVYDKTFTRVGMIGNPKFVTISPKFNGAGTATVSLLATHKMIPHLVAPGARLVYQDLADGHLMSGWVTKIRGSGPLKQELVEVDIVDDFTVLSEILGWVQPSEPITNQGIAGDNWVMTGAAETVLKAAVTANGIARMGMPLTCATDLGRGSSITANLRFHPLYDRLFPVVDGAGIDAAGIGVTVKQVGAGLVLDCFAPSVYPRTLTPGSGILQEWSYNLATPTATRAAIGGQGEAQARLFRTVTDTTRETTYGRIIERFRDARDVDVTDVTTLYARGQQTLDDGAPKSGLSVKLSGTPNFRSIKVGDKVTIAISPTFTITDVIKEATLSWTQENGWVTTPKIGERSDDPDTLLAKTLQGIARKLSNQNRT